MNISALAPAKAGRKPHPEPVGTFKVTARGEQLARLEHAVESGRMRSVSHYLLQCESELHALKTAGDVA